MLAMCASVRRERQLAGRFERDIERHLARVVAGELERRDLKRSLHGAEVRKDQLPVADRACEEEFADLRVGLLIFEDAAAAQRRALNAAAIEQLAPAPGALGVGDVDRRRIEAQ